MKNLALGLAGLCLLAAGAGAAATYDWDGETDDAAPSAARPDTQVAADGARTQLGDRAAPTDDPVPADITTATPSAGTVAPLEGPFDDRFRWRELRFDQGTATGAVEVTSDVSDLLELQVVAGFYDADGRYLGLARYTHHLSDGGHSDEGPPSELEQFSVAAPADIRARTVSATVGVPVLVNE